MGSLIPATSLPNLHPAVVHFPIALLVVAAGVDALALALRRFLWLHRSAAALLAVGAAAAWLAVLTGERAADSLAGVPARVQPLIGEHHDWAERTAWVFTGLALVRLALAWADRGAERPRRLPVRAVVLAGLVTAQWFLFQTSDRGGALVYRHGLAVAAATESSPEKRMEPAREVETSPPESRFVRGDDGAWRWTPLPTDARALQTVLTPVPGSESGAVKAGPPPGESGGFALECSGRSVLAFPGTFSDVQVEASVDVSAFRGTIGVLHHVRGAEESAAFELATAGGAALVLSNNGRKVLDEGRYDVPSGSFTLAVSASGRHLKGMVNGAVVVHGHADPPAAGGVGLLLDGDGVVVVHSVQVTPLEGSTSG